MDIKILFSEQEAWEYFYKKKNKLDFDLKLYRPKFNETLEDYINTFGRFHLIDKIDLQILEKCEVKGFIGFKILSGKEDLFKLTVKIGRKYLPIKGYIEEEKLFVFNDYKKEDTIKQVFYQIDYINKRINKFNDEVIQKTKNNFSLFSNRYIEEKKANKFYYNKKECSEEEIKNLFNKIKKMKDWQKQILELDKIEDYYIKVVGCSDDTRFLFNKMKYNQLRAYLTWRTKIKKGLFDKISPSFVYFYFYECISRKGTPQKILIDFIDFWKKYIEVDDNKEIHKRLYKWIWDYYVLNNIKIDFWDIYNSLPYKEGLALNFDGNISKEFLLENSIYKFNNNPFFKVGMGDIYIKVVNSVLIDLKKYLFNKNIKIEEILGHSYVMDVSVFYKLFSYDYRKEFDIFEKNVSDNFFKKKVVLPISLPCGRHYYNNGERVCVCEEFFFQNPYRGIIGYLLKYIENELLLKFSIFEENKIDLEEFEVKLYNRFYEESIIKKVQAEFLKEDFCIVIEKSINNFITNLQNEEKEKYKEISKLLQVWNSRQISSGEFLVKKYLQEQGICYKTQYDTLCCVNPKTQCILPYDFELPEHKIIIEIQGEQHLGFVKYFHGVEDNFYYQQYKDKVKKEFAINNGYRYIELTYNDFKLDKYKKIINAVIEK